MAEVGGPGPNQRGRHAWEDLLLAGARHEGLAESRHSLFEKLHKLSRLIWQKLIFFSKFEDSINRRKRILWKEGEAEPQGAITSGGLQLAGTWEVCSWRRPPG